MQPTQPNYAPNVVNQTVDYGGATWKGNPGTGWTMQNLNPAATNFSSTPQKTDVNPATGKSYDTNPATGVPDDNYWAAVAEPALKNAGAGGLNGASGAVGSLGAAAGNGGLDLVALTNSAYNTPEITAANKAIEDIGTQITTRQKALADAQAGINDNPFYSEATRVGRSQKLTQQANDDVIVFQNQAKAAQDKLATLRADAEIKVNAAKGQYDINNAASKEAFNQFQTLLQSGALDNVSGSDIANITRATGVSSTMIQSAVNAQKKKNVKTSIIQYDDGDHTGYAVVNADTGEVINKQIVAVSKPTAIEQKAALGIGTGTKKVSAADTKAQALVVAKQGANAGVTLGTMMNELGQYGLSKQQIYNAYSAANHYKPTAAQIKADKKKYGVK